MKKQLILENIKCGGCEQTIRKALMKMGAEDIELDHENGSVDFSYQNEKHLESIRKKLESLGYPDAGQSNFRLRARSYVSCMIGRLQGNPD